MKVPPQPQRLALLFKNMQLSDREGDTAIEKTTVITTC